MHGRIDVYTRSVLPLPGVTTVLLAAMHRRRMSHGRARVDSTSPYTRTAMARRMWRLMVSQANHADQVIVPSAHFARKLVAQGVEAPLSVLSNGLEASVLDEIGAPEARVVAPGEQLRVMWCGRLSPEKRPEVFLDAMALVTGAVGHMYGDGVSRAAVSRRAAIVPDGRVTVHGGVAQSEVLDAMRQAHVLVSSSLDFDNQPMVVLEAIASGLPVVVTDPDLAETLPPGGGLVTPTTDATGLAETLTRLRDDPAELARLSRAAIDHRAQIAQTTHRAALVSVYEAALATVR
jgi:glycosyltransferase involved in cell wall biosynthesis